MFRLRFVWDQWIRAGLIPQADLPEWVLTLCKRELLRVSRPSGSPGTGQPVPPAYLAWFPQPHDLPLALTLALLKQFFRSHGIHGTPDVQKKTYLVMKIVAVGAFGAFPLRIAVTCCADSF